MSEEVASAFVERRAFEAALAETESYRAANAALESQLAASHEALLLAQADSETRAQALDYYGTHEEDCAGWRDKACSCGYDATRAAHPGQSLSDEVAAARVENAYLREWIRGECSIADADINEAMATDFAKDARRKAKADADAALLAVADKAGAE